MIFAMGIARSQQVNKYYEAFKNIEITFTKEVIQAMNLNPHQSMIRIVGEASEQSLCIVNSASMLAAKVIVPKSSKIYQKLSASPHIVSLKLSFFEPDGKGELSFFVSGKVTGCRPYHASPDLLLVNIEYTQRAPDDLIEKLGLMFDARVTTSKRSDDRIELTPKNMKKMGLATKETIISIENIPRRCILRDISFSGAKLIVAGVAPFLLNKQCVLKFTFEEPDVILGLTGKIMRAEMVEGRKDLIAVAMQYTNNKVSLAYKVRLTQYFNQVRKVYIDEEQEDES